MSRDKEKLTIQEIADMVDVSKATVSRVLNDKEDVNPGTRQEIKDIIEEYNYKPSPLARCLNKRGTQNLGLAIPHTAEYIFSFPYFSELIRSVSHFASEEGYRLILETTRAETGEENAYKDLVTSGVIDGLILLEVRTQDKRIEFLQDNDVPFMVVGRSFEYPDIDYVDSNNVTGARDATEYLIDLGYERINFLNGPEDHSVSYYREKGYRQALERNDLEVREEDITYCQFTIDSGYENIRSLLDEGREINAIFAASDLSAIDAIKALKEDGIEPGKDMSIIGFDNIPFSKVFEPPLSTVKQPIFDIGHGVVDALIAKLRGDVTEPIQTVLENELVVRESTISRREARM